MPKQMRSGDYVVFKYEFKTLHSFLEYLKTAPVNTRVFDLQHLDSYQTDMSGWYGTKTFDEAVDLCRRGWSENFETLIRLKGEIDKKLLHPDYRLRRIADVTGYAPIVPAYLNGHPLNMHNHIKRAIPTFVDVYVNIAFNCGTSITAILNRGAITLSLIDALEDRGYVVRLHAFAMIHLESEIIWGDFDLKSDGEKLNIGRCYFPLCHPSFYRRLIFRLMEATPVQNPEWIDGYGYPSNMDEVSQVLKPGPHCLVILQPSQMDVRGESLNRDLDAMLRFTNLEEVMAQV